MSSHVEGIRHAICDQVLDIFWFCLCFVFFLVPGNFCQLLRIWLDRKMRPLKINWGVFSIFAVSLIMPNYENFRSFTSLETIQVQNDFYLFLQLRYWQKREPPPAGWGDINLVNWKLSPTLGAARHFTFMSHKQRPIILSI